MEDNTAPELHEVLKVLFPVITVAIPWTPVPAQSDRRV